MLLQREPFLTMFYTNNSSTMLVTKVRSFKLIYETLRKIHHSPNMFINAFLPITRRLYFVFDDIDKIIINESYYSKVINVNKYVTWRTLQMAKSISGVLLINCVI